MSLGKITNFFFLIFSLGTTAYAQGDTKLDLVPNEVLEAKFQALDSSTLISLADHKDRLVVLALWASWCGPCRVAFTGLNDLNEAFASRGVDLIALSTENPDVGADAVRIFWKESKISFKLGWIGGENAHRLMGGRDVIPQFLVIAGGRVIVKRFIGWNPQHTLLRLREAVEEALSHPTPSASAAIKLSDIRSSSRIRSDLQTLRYE